MRQRKAPEQRRQVKPEGEISLTVNLFKVTGLITFRLIDKLVCLF